MKGMYYCAHQESHIDDKRNCDLDYTDNFGSASLICVLVQGKAIDALAWP